MSPQASAREGARGRRPSVGVPSTGAPARGEARPNLSVLDRRVLVERARRRREHLLLAASGLLVAGALGIVAAGQGVVTSQQLHLDQLNQQIATAVAKTQRLELSRARLAAPSRVLEIAQKRLHMVAPAQVNYLSPVTPPAPAAGSPAAGGQHGSVVRHRRGG